MAALTRRSVLSSSVGLAAAGALMRPYNCCNKVEKKRSLYGVPYLQGGLVNHIWRSLVEQAGRKTDEIPKTWDARYDFFKGLQQQLRAQGMRNLYAVGFTVSAVGVDTIN